MILAIETATRICSVALFDSSGVKCVLESDEDNAHSRILHVLIDRLLKEQGITLGELSAVAVSKGPGSYTGLRIGVSAAKGLCYAKDLPLVAVNTLESMAFGIREAIDHDTFDDAGRINDNSQLIIVPMIDARRMEVYSAIYDYELKEVRETAAEIITSDSFVEFERKILVFGGDGAGKTRELLSGDNTIFLRDNFNTSARFMMHSALQAFEKKQFENIAYFEPFYLKDFIAGKPRVKGLD